jgi:hypothetical protein
LRTSENAVSREVQLLRITIPRTSVNRIYRGKAETLAASGLLPVFMPLPRARVRTMVGPRAKLRKTMQRSGTPTDRR